MVNLVREQRFREDPDYDRKTRWENNLRRLRAGMGLLKINKSGGKSLAKQKPYWFCVATGIINIIFGIGKVFTQSKPVKEGVREVVDFFLDHLTESKNEFIIEEE